MFPIKSYWFHGLDCFPVIQVKYLCAPECTMQAINKGQECLITTGGTFSTEKLFHL